MSLIHLFLLAIYKNFPKRAFLARYLLCIWKTVFPTASPRRDFQTFRQSGS
ncbi:hypothetical protein DESPIG_01828 [Desulfovibrio piger ATCC 29098]|uniref:Uncharacterized protein n=1 Tax=Desulfovibrio piger ATCC 29098 TaxID=411464 RepID=B6WUR7_9BACT|nr:hypothetical protein DESPIG_01828 [Desulfovibrio piger ATCC 29098]